MFLFPKRLLYMHVISTLLWLLSALLLSSCGTKVKKDELQFRNGFAYEINSQSPFNGQMEDYYDNEKVKSEYEYDQGLMNGMCIDYYENGQIKRQGTYTQGEADGLVLEYLIMVPYLIV